MGVGGLGTGGRAAEGLALARWLPTPVPAPEVTWEAWLCTQLERAFVVLFEIKL